MMRLLIIAGAVLFCTGCQLINGGAKQVAPQPVENQVLVEPVMQLPELSLDELKTELRVRSYQFVEKPEVTSSKSPQVQVVVENITPERELSFELATDFLDEDGRLVERTEWVAFDISPGEVYQYIASTSSTYAREGKVRLRRIKNLKKEETRSTTE